MPLFICFVRSEEKKTNSEKFPFCCGGLVPRLFQKTFFPNNTQNLLKNVLTKFSLWLIFASVLFYADIALWRKKV
jgi:hypothetical protein